MFEEFYLVFFMPYGTLKIKAEEKSAKEIRSYYGSLLTSVTLPFSDNPLAVFEWLDCAAVGEHCQITERNVYLVRIS